jgi:hypothetical protein
VRVPEGITNVPSWEEHCRKIHARATDFISGKYGVIQAARALSKIAIWARAESDPDILVFRTIDSETAFLPAGPERNYWAKHALEREDSKILAAESKWRQAALVAATNLVANYHWALEARRRRRKAGSVA